jgi:hypothetical protein
MQALSYYYYMKITKGHGMVTVIDVVSCMVVLDFYEFYE